jgi:hypothetical protein
MEKEGGEEVKSQNAKVKMQKYEKRVLISHFFTFDF